MQAAPRKTVTGGQWRASAELTYPSFVSCEGPGFAPVWQNFRHLRQEALRVGLSSEALVELQAKASYIIDQWDSLHGGFCLHGYVAALSCLLHHLKGRITGANAQALTARMQNALGPERSLELLLDAWSEFQLQSADDSCLFLGQKRGSYL
eukprot:g7270.t1